MKSGTRRATPGYRYSSHASDRFIGAHRSLRFLDCQHPKTYAIYLADFARSALSAGHATPDTSAMEEVDDDFNTGSTSAVSVTTCIEHRHTGYSL